jgi:hypothetical protein
MTPIRTFAVASLPVPSTARHRVARVEKISLSSTLDGEREDNAKSQPFAGAKRARMQAFQNETTHDVTPKDEMRLVPAFVTQLLSQFTISAMPDAASALLAYGRAHPQIARVCDRNV